MKFYYLIVVLFLLFSCKKTRDNTDAIKEIPTSYVLRSVANYKGDTVYVKGKKFSGFLYQCYSKTIDTFAIQSYHNGLKKGISKKWYRDHKLMELRCFSEGKKNGQQVAYWNNGNKRFEYIAENDAYKDEMREWDEKGMLIHLAHYNKDGQEEGVQKLWYSNGKIRANYVIIDGKRFGLLGTKNCVNVSDSIFINK